MRGTYFGNGVWVTEGGQLRVEFSSPAGASDAQVTRSFKESVEQAVAFVDRHQGGGTPVAGHAPEALLERKNHDPS